MGLSIDTVQKGATSLDPISAFLGEVLRILCSRMTLRGDQGSSCGARS